LGKGAVAAGKMGQSHRPVSPQPPRVFRISFYSFLLKDFSPLSWSLEQDTLIMLGSPRNPRALAFPVVWK